MFKLSSAQVWVHDQDEALAWWTRKVGFEVRTDVTVSELDDFRWLTIGPPGDDGTEIVLMAIPGEPVFTEAERLAIVGPSGSGNAPHRLPAPPVAPTPDPARLTALLYYLL